ncbi:MAG: sugar phosphate nucleotidyltransferase [bacterium]
MNVIIPVAGSGTRLRPHTYATQKALLPVANRPILDHIVAPLSELSVEQCVFVIGHLGSQIREHVTDNYDLPASFVRQDSLLGLGYAIHQGLRSIAPGPTLIVLGDTIAKCDLQQFTSGNHHRLGVCEVDDPHRFGVAQVDNGLIVELEEKPQQPKSNLALIGLYFFQDSRVLFDMLDQLVSQGRTTRGEIQLTDALAMMIKAGERFEPFAVDGWYDCGQKDTWLATNRHLLQSGENSPADAGSSIIVSPSAQIGESDLGPNVAVDSGAIVRRSRLKNCIIGAGALIEDSTLVDSIVGRGAVVRGVHGSVNVGPDSEISQR